MRIGCGSCQSEGLPNERNDGGHLLGVEQPAREVAMPPTSGAKELPLSLSAASTTA